MDTRDTDFETKMTVPGSKKDQKDISGLMARFRSDLKLLGYTAPDFGVERIYRPSGRALHIAARVWQDQEMRRVTMDEKAATAIACIIDHVLQEED